MSRCGFGSTCWGRLWDCPKEDMAAGSTRVYHHQLWDPKEMRPLGLHGFSQMWDYLEEIYPLGPCSSDQLGDHPRRMCPLGPRGCSQMWDCLEIYPLGPRAWGQLGENPVRLVLPVLLIGFNSGVTLVRCMPPLSTW